MAYKDEGKADTVLYVRMNRDTIKWLKRYAFDREETITTVVSRLIEDLKETVEEDKRQSQ